MPRKEWKQWLSKDFAIFVRRDTERGVVRRFSVVLIYRDVCISRYDTAHGYAHRDVLGLAKGWINSIPCSVEMNYTQAYDSAIRDYEKIMKATSHSSSKTKVAPVGSDRYMIERGFQEMSPHESRKYAHFFVERRREGDYAIRRAGSVRASAVAPTQAKAIERARELDPGVSLQVKRVRNHKNGRSNKWRKA